MRKFLKAAVAVLAVGGAVGLGVAPAMASTTGTAPATVFMHG